MSAIYKVCFLHGVVSVKWRLGVANEVAFVELSGSGVCRRHRPGDICVCSDTLRDRPLKRRTPMMAPVHRLEIEEMMDDYRTQGV